MNVGRPHQSIPARAVVALLIAALALMRALIPSGYMLERDEDDQRFVVHMCSGAAARSVVIDLKTGAVSENPGRQDTTAPSDTRKGETGDISCPFALAAVASLPTVSAPAAPTVQNDLLTARHFAIAPPIVWLSRPPLPGRGPPGVA
jgi:hypothetical protein